MTGFGHRPQHLLGTVGLLGFLLGGLGVLALSVGWIVTRLDEIPGNDLHLHQRAVFYYSMGLALLGAQFLTDMFAKVEVSGENASDLYKFLTSLDAKPKGTGKIGWNFEKFLIDRKGMVVARFGSSTKPDAPDLVKVIERELARSVEMEEEQTQ